MSRHDENPYVRFGLDPSASLATLTERMRELAADANDEERAVLRAAWDALSRSPARRLELALEAGPTPAPILASPVLSRTPAPWPEPTLADVLGPPALAPRLPAPLPDEQALLALDLSFLVLEDEVAVTGALAGRRPR